MKKSARYDSLIQWYWMRAGQKYAFDEVVDWRLVKSQIRQESGFIPDAVSAAGARGLMQIMPETWGSGFEIQAFNPEKSIERGIDHLGRMWSIFKAESGLERWKFALGSYNCGQGWVIKSQVLLKARGLRTDLWDNIVRVLPTLTGADNAAQTTKYVATIMKEFEEGREELC